MSGMYHFDDTTGFFMPERQEDNAPVKSAEPTPTGKGNSVFLSAVQGRAASGFAENILARPVFSCKTRIPPEHGPFEAVEVNPADSFIHNHKK